MLLLITASGIARACDCPSDSLSEKLIRSYDFIFSGKVIAVSGCDKNAHVTFQIEQLFKGKSFATTAVEFDCTSDCQMSFVPGEEWIIYSNYVSYGNAKVEFCSLSRKKMSPGEDDFNTISHGMDFDSEKKKLLVMFGEQKLNKVDPKSEQHHELIHPNGMQTLLYLIGGFAGLVLFYFLGKKFLK